MCSSWLASKNVFLAYQQKLPLPPLVHIHDYATNYSTIKTATSHRDMLQTAASQHFPMSKTENVMTADMSCLRYCPKMVINTLRHSDQPQLCVPPAVTL